ncbi:IDEAL domain-containing protein [Alkalihalobacterium elongatum]|uniref:IDEAL domain-containing protein n=1 Tax=Alkalihalobacterium elongatum TaxID=2675466 RepID=UPI001C1F6C87|nr:IDEAL domain-containing protein [Alkalihalobacterium elongatum]
MNKFAIDKKLMKQLAAIRNKKKPSEEILNSLYAQAMLEYSIYEYQKNEICNQIDEALEAEDEKRFFVLSTHYNELLDRYRPGKTLFEKGYELNIQFFD